MQRSPALTSRGRDGHCFLLGKSHGADIQCGENDGPVNQGVIRALHLRSRAGGTEDHTHLARVQGDRSQVGTVQCSSLQSAITRKTMRSFAHDTDLDDSNARKIVQVVPLL